MEDSHGKNMPSLEDTSSDKIISVDEFEDKLREENMRLLRNLRLKEMMSRVKSNDPAQWPFK